MSDQFDFLPLWLRYRPLNSKDVILANTKVANLQIGVKP